ncbi:hypothetical protein CEUSTIGMA_g7933.t1 [Chlamydomonas eustigma]|uniref:EGF-like domain-containing protein n=1 Tax=Chlamydomonas eustigma TaxID=1157962 RepID=A0A250XBN6_9CHLO|nr:hypothetical protein CEUSTIGMA_g7933.t1 [Chlamydomonas eustigma]|eukprot:GAX80495.1 hypothetical protein CEUSTIGMA_g7933.t1 [Chlamydomonas eustigma]
MNDLQQNLTHKMTTICCKSHSVTILVRIILLLLHLTGSSWERDLELASIEDRLLPDLHHAPGEDHTRFSSTSRILQLLDHHKIQDASHMSSNMFLVHRELLNGLSEKLFEGTDIGRSQSKRNPENRRCSHTIGNWCGLHEQQPLSAYEPAPRGSKQCPGNCSSVGNCNYDTGLCDCPAGWTGLDCGTLFLRPCTNRDRSTGDAPASHVDLNGRDLDWTVPGWKASRCAGVCDTETGECYCDGNLGRIPAPTGSPPGTQPIRQGRMLPDFCQPHKTPLGEEVPWTHSNRRMDPYGPQGWCMAVKPDHFCGCYLDGSHGNLCELRHEAVCANQCSGHGVCERGFCKCDNGWYGTDCMRKIAGSVMEAGSLPNRPWLRTVAAIAPEALPESTTTPPQSNPREEQRRPLIFVYDLPPEYNARMLQYRGNRPACVYRYWNEENAVLQQRSNLYGLETYMHETLLQSKHRTFDPEKADYFYVPVYYTCLIHPIYSQADMPWYPGPLKLRCLQASNLLLKLKRYIEATYPYWNRSQGKDHIWLALHDEGACWFPTEIYENSVILTHWGRTDLDHQSNTAYSRDNYSMPLSHPEWMPEDWRKIHQGHACFTPGKDLVLPSFKWPAHYQHSPLIGATPMKRDILLFFKGDVGLRREAWYSRGIRQRLHRLSQQQGWRTKYNIWIGASEEIGDGYSVFLARSKFCLVAPGDGWSSRAEDAMLHGCIPVIIMDEVQTIYETLLNWPSFSIRMNERDLDKLPEILLSVSGEKVAKMHRSITRVWNRFAYTSGVAVRGAFLSVLDENIKQRGSENSTPLAWLRPHQSLKSQPWPHDDDAFSTIMQWLYYRLSFVKSAPRH